MTDDSDILDGIKDDFEAGTPTSDNSDKITEDPNSELNDVEEREIANTTDDVYIELIAYNSDFPRVDLDNEFGTDHRVAVFFSIENLSNDVIRLYGNGFDLTGDDGFVYETMEAPWNEIPDEHYPRHYADSFDATIPVGSKLRYLLVSAPLPEGTIGVRQVDYAKNYTFSLRLPDNLPETFGNPPL